MTAAVLAAVAIAGIPGAYAQQIPSPPCSACVGFIASAGQTLLLPPELNSVEVVVRAVGAPDDVRRAQEAIRVAGGRPGLWFEGINSVAAYEGLIPAAHRVVIDVTAESGSADELAFRLKTRVTDLRGVAANVRVGIVASETAIGELRGRGLAPYLDFVAAFTADRPTFFRSLSALPTAVAVRTVGEGATAGAFEAWLLPLPGDVVDAQRAIGDVAATAPILKPGLISGGMVEVRCGGDALPTYLDPESLDTVALAACNDRPVTVSPEVSGISIVPLASGGEVIRVPATEGRFAEGVRVVGGRALSVREIIARHQAAAARQRRGVQRLISTGRMTLTFEAPGFPAPIAITSDAVIFAAPDAVEIEQRDVRVNGIAFQGGSVPRLPLLEPERVASPPLAISLSDLYRYALEGEEDEGGVRCYVVAFSPIERTRPLYAGRAWIAMDDFGMVKVSAVQTGLRGPIVSSEQTDEFRRQGSLWLLARSDVRQLYEGAGHRTPIHRVLAIDRQEVNPAAFAERRQAAYASPAVMLRDTPEGFRYLRRERSATDAAVVETAVAGRAERVRTVALGVILDPNISRPLPFAGLSYVDFNLLGTGTQVNGFFGGTYGQLAVAVPSLAGTRWQLGGQAFGIVSSYNDRAFVNGREHYERNISQRPAHAAVWLLRPLTARFTARVGYDFDYTGYGRVSSTAASFVVPPAQVAYALRLALEGQWAGWSASIWWSGARRAGWRNWGEEALAPGETELDGYHPRHADFQRAGAVVTRSFVASPRLVGRIEAAWMSGRDLDRFSRYSFGSFDNRLRGYPSALIRYDRGAVIRTSVAWAAGRLLRLDGFADTAYVRDPGFGPRSKSYTGIGAAAEVPAPFGTLLAVEWGYGFQGVNSNGRRGTQVVRISGYKMF